MSDEQESADTKDSDGLDLAVRLMNVVLEDHMGEFPPVGETVAQLLDRVREHLSDLVKALPEGEYYG